MGGFQLFIRYPSSLLGYFDNVTSIYDDSDIFTED
jgi:hypothetical protein